MNQNNSRINYMTPMGQELDQIVNTCKILSTCPYYQKMGMGGILAIWLMAKEMNLPVMTCLNGGMYTFSGQVTISSQLMNLMIVNAGHRADIIKLDDSGCKINFVRSDRKGKNSEFTYEFTKEMASIAGYLGKDVWKKHTRDMLFSRCLSGGARKFMPDVIANCYVQGEIEDDRDGNIAPLIPSNIARTTEKLSAYDESAEINDKPLESPISCIESKDENWDNFFDKYSDPEECLVDKFFEEVSENSGKHYIFIANRAIRNEKAFIEVFDKWKNENEKKKTLEIKEPESI